jgi:hypothetical protein
MIEATGVSRLSGIGMAVAMYFAAQRLKQNFKCGCNLLTRKDLAETWREKGP